MDTSYSLKPLGLLCAALCVDDKLGHRPFHLTAFSRVELRVSFQNRFDVKIKFDPKIKFHTKIKPDP